MRTSTLSLLLILSMLLAFLPVTAVAAESELPTGRVESTGQTLLLEEQIIIAAYAQFVGFEDIDPIEKGGLLVWTSEVTAETATYETADQVHPGMVERPDKYNGMPEYEQYTDGIPAMQYGDTVYFRPYLEIADGVYEYGELKTYGVYAYCQRQLQRTDEDLKKLCAEILHYGAAAQLQLKYKTDALVNDVSFIPEMANYPAAAWDASYLDAVADVPETNIVQTEGTSRTAATLLLEGAIVMRMTFKPATTFEKAEMLVWKADEVTAPLTEANFLRGRRIRGGSRLCGRVVFRY